VHVEADIWLLIFDDIWNGYVPLCGSQNHLIAGTLQAV